jgi:hypothetical protein
VHCFNDFVALSSPGDIGLVGCDDEDEASGGKTVTSVCHARKQFKFCDRFRREGFAIADDLSVEGSVSIEKDRGP